MRYTRPSDGEWVQHKRAFMTSDRIQEILRCPHDDRTGGNDYLLCNLCGLQWDYRKFPDGPAGARDAMAQLVLAALSTAEAEGRRLAELVRDYQQADAFHGRQGYDECGCNVHLERQHCCDVADARSAILLFDLRQLLPVEQTERTR